MVLKSRIVAIVCFCLLRAIFYSADANSLRYRIKKGDTLIRVARRFFEGPVLSRKGSLRKILERNSWIKNPNLIRIGKYLDLEPSESAPKVSEKTELSTSRKVATEESKPAIVEEDQKNSVKGAFSISPDFLISQISVRDRVSGATADVYSKENAGLSFSYSQIWSETFQSYQRLGYRRFNSIPSAEGNALVHGNQNLWDLSVGGQWSLAKPMRLNFGAGSATRLILVGSDSTSAALDSMYIPYLASGAEWDFINARKIRIGLGGEYQLSFPIKAKLYNTKLNSGYAVKSYFIQNIFRSEAEIGTLVQYQRQDTNITTQSMINFGLYLKMNTTFGDDK